MNDKESLEESNLIIVGLLKKFHCEAGLTLDDRDVETFTGVLRVERDKDAKTHTVRILRTTSDKPKGHKRCPGFAKKRKGKAKA